MEEALARSGLFHDVETEAADALATQLKYHDYFKGDVIFADGDDGDSLYVVLEGKIKLRRRSPDGREFLIAVLGPSDLLGELAVIDPAPRTASAVVASDARVAQMHQDQWRAWLAERPEAGRHFLRILTRRAREADQQHADLIFSDVAGRLAKALLALTRRFGVSVQGVVRLHHDLTQEELAHLVGASRETVNKALSDFVSRGWIRLDGKAVVLLDRDRLIRRAS